MSNVKTPITTPWVPLRELAPGPHPIAVTAQSFSDSCHQPFDFRASRFRDDAQTLARVTGLDLERCRQELFIAEGDLALAHQLLVHGYGVEPRQPTLH
jgi:hypothetical protein